MPRDIRQFRVFVASPGDVAEERDRLEQAIALINGLADVDGYELGLWRYETHADPGLGRDTQSVISAQVGDIDIFVGILWTRIGTPTADAISGTVQEFEDAFRAWEDSGRKRPRIMFYFKTEAVTPDLSALPQLTQALKFRERIERHGLIADFADAGDFERKVALSLGRVAKGLHAAEQAAAASAQSPPQETGVRGEDEQDAESEDLIGLRLSLERKLTWLCKLLLPTGGDAPFATIGSLQYDGYLSMEQARLASRILALETGASPAQPEEIAEFRASAAQLVSTFRAVVFDNHVRRTLPDGWAAKPFPQQPGHRPDFLAVSGDTAYRVSARFALPAGASLVKKSVARLQRGADDPSELDDGPIRLAGRVVVVPDASQVEPGDESDGVRVVRQAQLADVLRTSQETPT